MCKKCPNAWGDAGFDPYYNSIFDAFYVERRLKEFIDYDSDNPNVFVYFISDSHFMKIGIAKKPQKRLLELQTGNPNKLTVRYLIPCKNERCAYSAETLLHWLYKDYQRYGEWFDIDDKINDKTFKAMFNSETYMEVA